MQMHDKNAQGRTPDMLSWSIIDLLDSGTSILCGRNRLKTLLASRMVSRYGLMKGERQGIDRRAERDSTTTGDLLNMEVYADRTGVECW